MSMILYLDFKKASDRVPYYRSIGEYSAMNKRLSKGRGNENNIKEEVLILAFAMSIFYKKIN